MIRCTICGKEIHSPKRKYCSDKCYRIGQQIQKKPYPPLTIDEEKAEIGRTITKLEQDLHFIARRSRICHKHTGKLRILCYVLAQKGFSLILAAKVMGKSDNNLYAHVHSITDEEKELAKEYLDN
jgi:hypothetical protein